ncbi:hypothetical protein K461DRAFT_15332 [Myriangium duriaei CBS 260.36]|uniref:Trafficking protein particle complex II-specific subunit 65 IgD3 domain-containing protein n=1 Tax=Myriangium duriaei CBS 260.36 TaxID=1168546 RepID=A0A9P4JE48_9PEZI|nr:hypothetical protein K461DRAFT_15332 [Myriangium duriaei CBS 260.36]
MDPNSSMAPSTAEKSIFQKSTVQIVVPDTTPSLSDTTTQEEIDAVLSETKAGLFFDEITPILVLLRTQLPSEILALCMPYLNFSITAHLTAFPAQPGSTPQIPTEEPPIKLVLDTITAASPKLIVLPQSQPDASIAVFQAELHLRHPERILSRPAVYFSASVFLKPPTAPTPDPLDDYLPSGVPLSSNVLSPLLSAPPFANTHLSLPSSRLDKVIPLLNPTDTDIRPLRASTSTLKIHPVLLLRTTRTLFPSTVYLTLTISVPPTSPTLHLTSASTTIPNLPITLLPTPSLPTTLYPTDRTTLTFTSTPPAATAPISLTLLATLSSRPIKLHRLLPPPTPRAPPTTRSKHWSAPASRPTTAISGPGGVKGELRLSLSGPQRVRRGDEFKLTLFVLNSTRRKRRLGIVGPVVRGGGRTGSTGRGGSVANAVMDSREVMGLIYGGGERRRSVGGGIRGGGGAYRAEVVCLDTEVRCVLQPGGCQDVALRLRAVSVGAIGVEGIVVVDLDSRETCVIGEGWEAVCFEDSEDLMT